MDEYKVKLRDTTKHKIQDAFVHCEAKRIAIKAGRRGGKTVGIAKRAVLRFLKGRRQLYGAPTIEQVERFWFEVCAALSEPIEAGVFEKNETKHIIELPHTEQRIKAKTCWNANTLRGDYADDLYLDEWQLMAEDTWEEVGAPMLVDNNGDVVFVHTPPSLSSSGVSKARDLRHASKQFKEVEKDKSGRWATFQFSSHENPYISGEALEDIIRDMTPDAYRREILAQDDEIEQSWLVYGKFNPAVCKIPRFDIPMGWPVYTGHDFGSANPGALFAAQNPGTHELFIWKEYAPGGKSAYEHVQAFKKIVTLPGQGEAENPKTYNVIRRIGGNVTTEDEIRQAYTSHGWPIVAPRITKVNAQIDRVIGLMELNKIFIFDDLHNLLNQMYNCLWVLDDQNKPTNKIQDEQKYHLLACLRYMGSDFYPDTAISNKPKIYRGARF